MTEVTVELQLSQGIVLMGNSV